ncbi:MAG TPA: hypothetical protein PLX84_11015 [Acidiphilium sp.]|nr:hypothetical protein [Acidiphilium sp.]
MQRTFGFSGPEQIPRENIASNQLELGLEPDVKLRIEQLTKVDAALYGAAKQGMLRSQR